VARYDHILLLSVDGMHAVDLENYIAANPMSTFAKLAKNGIRYPNTMSSGPSDSFPGLLALVTGGTSKSTGVFYDNSYDRSFFAPGSICTGSPGTNTLYDESIDNNKTSFDAGGTLGEVVSQINSANLPRALVGGVCTPVYPHSFLNVN